ncbi:MAG TPA: TetR/AcrR family transcriptional regulator [Candidatus Sulfopaludibacter sp.]|nr:TetR/AcrR family transcriptional regulator [Candidatus Sulfopaludibacter sp.]
MNDRSTRERLLEAGRFLFWERGYAATGIAEILARAQANAGSFYHFFPGKEALLLAVLDSYLEGLEPVIVQPAFAATPDPVERIFAILAGYRERLVQTDCSYGCPLGRLALEIEAENLPAHGRIAANFKGWTGAVRRCLEDARERLPAELDLDSLATFVLTVMEGGVMQSRSHRRMEPFDQSVAQLRNYFACLTGNQERNDEESVGSRNRQRGGGLGRRRAGKARKPGKGK